MILPLLSVAYAGTVLYQLLVVNQLKLATDINSKDLYAWHPVLSNAFLVFAALGMNSAQSIRGSVAASRAAKEGYVNAHALLNWLALFSLAGSGAAIFLNKERNARPHLTSYHSMTGAATSIAFLLNVFGGVAMRTVPGMYKYIKFHRLNGYLLFLALLGAHGTAVWRGYAGFQPSEPGRLVLVGLLGAMGLATLARVKTSLLPGGAKDAAKSN
ncbi:hypothetical protein HYH03_011532 [Edaphochlamys debaryana]|uniref:Cytochrome b561 domain-containing protein n=1 Tax=Edaphochlamys debaryana TaxID=47281 RepID=A0A835XRX6_9CHLO|nr:hypothetical protein HYH03_011532 [Edaphochlamys debaryana]|eukprot:KAG2490067.1 hypothetical protein HYH03_011532 [Edaphochlamys debaryana]